MRSQFRTTPWRSFLAILACLSICAAIIGAIVTFVAALDARFQSVDWNWVGQQFGGSALLIVGAVGAVICVIGIPLWLPLHFAGRRHWVLAVLLGALLFFVGWFGPHTAWFSMPLSGDGYDDYGWSDAVGASVGAALVAFVMWRVAYRKAPEVA
jgi:hypothetical protein